MKGLFGLKEVIAIIVGKSVWLGQEVGIAEHISSAVKKKRVINVRAYLTFTFLYSPGYYLW